MLDDLTVGMCSLMNCFLVDLMSRAVPSIIEQSSA